MLILNVIKIWSILKLFLQAQSPFFEFSGESPRWICVWLWDSPLLNWMLRSTASPVPETRLRRKYP